MNANNNMKSKNNWKKKSGRYRPHYTEHLSFKERLINDVFEERLMWDDWNDHRDGIRSSWSEKFERQSKRTKQYLNKLYWRKNKTPKLLFKGHKYNEDNKMVHQIMPEYAPLKFSDYYSIEEMLSLRL